MAAIIRLACGLDAEQIAAIYAPVVAGTAISFEIEPPDPTEMERRIASTMAGYPWLVCDNGGELLGYAYASMHRARPAYQRSVETTIYGNNRYRRLGVGRALYAALLNVLPLQGYYNAYAGVTLPNPASVGLHEALGSEFIGTFRKVGYKLGRWHDVGWWQRPLQPPTEPPAEPFALSAVTGSDAFQSCLALGARTLLQQPARTA